MSMAGGGTVDSMMLDVGRIRLPAGAGRLSCELNCARRLLGVEAVEGDLLSLGTFRRFASLCEGTRRDLSPVRLGSLTRHFTAAGEASLEVTRPLFGAAFGRKTTAGLEGLPIWGMLEVEEGRGDLPGTELHLTRCTAECT